MAMRQRLRRISVFISLTVLILFFQNFDVATNAPTQGAEASASSINSVDPDRGLRPYASQEVMLYQGGGAQLAGWIADPGATLEAFKDESLESVCSPDVAGGSAFDPYSFCWDYQFHLLKRNSAVVGGGFMRMKTGNYLKNQLYRVELDVEPSRDRMRVDFHVNGIRNDSAELYLAQGGSNQKVYFSFLSDQSENELSLATDQVGDALKIRFIRIFRLPIEDQLIVNGGFDKGLLKNWTVDAGPQVSVSSGVLNYRRQNSAYQSMFMRTLLNTEPGKIYKVSTVVKSNTKNMHFLINRIHAHDFIGATGTDTFAFQAKTTRTELALGGSNSFSAEFSIDSIHVLETSNSDFEVGLAGWSVDSGIVATAKKSDLRYNRNKAAWPNVFIQKRIPTVPGTQYEVRAQVGSNSHTLVFRVDGIIAKQSNTASGLMKFLFTAKNPETVVSVGGANSLNAIFQLTDFSVSPYWSSGGQYLFSTSTKYPGYLGGHEAANQYCAQHALQAKLPGKFKAVLAATIEPSSSSDPIDRYPVLYPLMNTQGYNEGLCDEKGNCENLGKSWVGARRYTLLAPGRTCNNWTQHDYQPTITYDVRGNPISTMPTIPDNIKMGAVWPANLGIPNFEDIWAVNQTGEDCATTNLSLMCLQDAETASFKKRRAYFTTFNDFLGPVDSLTGPRTVEGNNYVFQAREIDAGTSQPVKVFSSLLRNNSYAEYYNFVFLGELYRDNLEALSSGDGLTIEFPELVTSASLTLASLRRLSPLPYVDSHQSLNFGGEDSSYEILINGRVVQRLTVPAFNPSDLPNYRSLGWVPVSTADRSPFKKVQIRVIEGPSDLIRLYEIGYVTHD
jgi:hypothetical protein